MRKKKEECPSFLVLVLILSGCGTKSDVITITNVSYDPTREFYESYNTMFEEYYKKTYNKGSSGDTVARRLRQSGEVGCGRV